MPGLERRYVQNKTEKSLDFQIYFINKFDTKAWLNSMFFSTTNQKCFRFWYILNGNSVGTIKVFIYYEDGTKKLVWQLSTENQLNWYEGTVGFESAEMTYKYSIFEILCWSTDYKIIL